MAGGCEEQGDRREGKKVLRIPSLASLVCLCHSDDVPSPLLLGILATETQKWIKRRSQMEENDGKQKRCRDRCCKLEWSSGDTLKAGPPYVVHRPEGPRVPEVHAQGWRGRSSFSLPLPYCLYASSASLPLTLCPTLAQCHWQSKGEGTAKKGAKTRRERGRRKRRMDRLRTKWKKGNEDSSEEDNDDNDDAGLVKVQQHSFILFISHNPLPGNSFVFQ